MAHRRRVALISNDPGIVETVELALQSDYTVTALSNGRTGVVRAGELKPEVILIDLCLSDMTGLDVLRQCKASVPGAACIIVTGVGTCRSAVEAVRATLVPVPGGACTRERRYTAGARAATQAVASRVR